MLQSWLSVQLVLAKISVDTDSAFEDIDEEEMEKKKPPEERINLTVPGTKWCGPGYTADEYEDLGSYTDEDRCCRAHGKNQEPSGGQKKTVAFFVHNFPQAKCPLAVKVFKKMAVIFKNCLSDHCDAISSQESKYGLTNNDYFTR